jgi:hypothetical protein
VHAGLPELHINAMCQGGIRTNLLFTMSDSTPAAAMQKPANLFSLADARNAWRQTRKFGGARRDRTDDLMLAKHALSQLSYGPVLG